MNRKTLSLGMILRPARLAALIVLLLLILISVMRSAAAQTVTEGFDSDQILQRGMLVALKDKSSTHIEPVTQENALRLHGVVVDPNDAPVTLSRDGQKTFVASVGQFDVLVSTQNGPITNGDYIAPSAVNGIGMKTDGEQKVVIGKALESFDGKSGTLSTATVKSTTGQERKISIGRVRVDLAVGSNPLAKQESNVPTFLNKVATTVAQKKSESGAHVCGFDSFCSDGNCG